MILLPTDILFMLLTAACLFLGIYYRRDPSLIRIYQGITQDKLAIWALVSLLLFWLIALLDCIHWQSNSVSNGGVQSLLDICLQPLLAHREIGYSAPWAQYSYEPGLHLNAQGAWIQSYVHLNISRTAVSLLHLMLTGLACLFAIILGCYAAYRHLRKRKPHYRCFYRTLMQGIGFWLMLIAGLMIFAPYAHIFGTDKIGQDILVEVIKSIRTAMILGILTSLFSMPIALVLGALAGYVGGLVDDIIYYLYTTLSSIPGILLIAASVLSLQIYWFNHPLHTTTPAARADFRLLALCIILGLTSWTQLCRVLRAQTFKLREQDYVLASKIQGVGTWGILARHIMPNLLPLVLISVVLDFSGLVLAEAVLTYVGVGVDPLTPSFGNLIDSARIEMAHTPVIWWPLLSTFVVMLLLVFAVNILADCVQKALNPRTADK